MKKYIILILFVTNSYQAAHGFGGTPEDLYKSALAYYTGKGAHEPTPNLAREEAQKIVKHPEASKELVAKAYLIIGKAYNDEGKVAEAIENLINIKTDNTDILQEMAELLYELGMQKFHEKSSPKKIRLEKDIRYILAVRAFKKALPFLEEKEKEAARLALGYIYVFGGYGIKPDSEKVIQYVQPVYSNPSSNANLDEVRYMLGTAYFYLGNKDKTLELLTPVAENNDSQYKHMASQLLGYTYFNANDWKNAISHLERTLNSALLSTSLQDRQELEVMLAKAYFNNDQYDKAEAMLQKLQSTAALPPEIQQDISDLKSKIQNLKEMSQGDESQEIADILMSIRDADIEG